LYRKRLSNLKWRFYHFGPYAHEIETFLGSPDLEQIPFDLKNGKSGASFKLTSYDIFENGKQDSGEEKRIIDNLVKEWGDADLNKLLDYVYFDTEPMKDAKRGDLLKFETIPPWKPPESVRNVHISPKKFKLLKEKYIPHIKIMSQEVTRKKSIFELMDKSYFDCKRAWDREGDSDIKIWGDAIFDLEESEKNEHTPKRIKRSYL